MPGTVLNGYRAEKQAKGFTIPLLNQVKSVIPLLLTSNTQQVMLRIMINIKKNRKTVVNKIVA